MLHYFIRCNVFEKNKRYSLIKVTKNKKDESANKHTTSILIA